MMAKFGSHKHTAAQQTAIMSLIVVLVATGVGTLVLVGWSSIGTPAFGLSCPACACTGRSVASMPTEVQAEYQHSSLSNASTVPLLCGGPGAIPSAPDALASSTAALRPSAAQAFAPWAERGFTMADIEATAEYLQADAAKAAIHMLVEVWHAAVEVGCLNCPLTHCFSW